MFNVTSETFETSQRSPFNNGQAGIVDVTIQSIAKDPDESKDRWVLTFEDKNGGTIRDFLTPISSDDPGLDRKMKAQGTVLRHLFEVIVADKNKAMSYQTPEEFLEGVMNQLAANFKGKAFRIVVDYGFGDRHNTRLNRRRYVPFLEQAVDDTTSLTMMHGAYTEPAKPTDFNDVDLNSSANKGSEGSGWLDN